MEKEKIFISYATEDKSFAYWLELKLRALGYSTWIDKDKLLGGESFVEDIDKAIKNESKCLVAIISKSSINKSAPRRERTLAASIGKELADTFLIPVMLDSFKTSELSWDISDLSHISFTNGWADGLAKLSRKLESINVPRSEPQLISLAYEVDSRYPKDEYIFDYAWANILRFVNIPDSLWRIETASPFIAQNFPNKYPFVRINDNEFWGFDDELPKSLFNITNKRGFYIPKSDTSSDLNKIRKNLIRKAIAIHARSLGMYGKKDTKNEFYFPYGSTENNRLQFTFDDKQHWIKHSGVRRFSYTEKFQYHLSFSYSLVGHGEDLYLHISPNFLLTDINDDPLDPARVLSRRKKLCKMMFNDAWLKRLMAITTFLFENNNEECHLYTSRNKSLTIEARPLKLEVLDN